ncbi:HTH_48 domain-containing protein [Trichonephila clavipes]|nr:HTH_48 domain-containing protein [Trichonephila clavipes]
MASQIPEEIHIHHCMLLEFHKGSNATVATKNICDVYPSALDVRKRQRRVHRGDECSTERDIYTEKEARFGGLEVARPLRKPEVAGSTPAGVDRFSGCENRRHVCHMII